MTTATKKGQKGRPSKFTPERIETLLRHIAEGNYIDTACRLADVDYTTIRHWVMLGERDGKGQYWEFAKQLKLAEAQAEADRVASIIKAGKFDDWKANAWYLERKYPERWGKKEFMDANIKSHHTETQELKIEQQIETDPQTVELVRQLWRRQQALGD